jgi:hypothetical protein
MTEAMKVAHKARDIFASQKLLIGPATSAGRMPNPQETMVIPVIYKRGVKNRNMFLDTNVG